MFDNARGKLGMNFSPGRAKLLVERIPGRHFITSFFIFMWNDTRDRHNCKRSRWRMHKQNQSKHIKSTKIGGGGA